MSFFGFLSSADSQGLALSRRELLRKSLAIGAVTLSPKSDVKPLSPAFILPQKYPAPKFAIGDQILSPCDEGDLDLDEEHDIPPEFGEIMGVCWNPKNETWEYVVKWTSGDASSCTYPVFDEALLCESSLRLVSAEEICKH